MKHWTLDAFRKETHTFKRCSAHQESKSSVCWEVADGMGLLYLCYLGVRRQISLSPPVPWASHLTFLTHSLLFDKINILFPVSGPS